MPDNHLTDEQIDGLIAAAEKAYAEISMSTRRVKWLEFTTLAQNYVLSLAREREEREMFNEPWTEIDDYDNWADDNCVDILDCNGRKIIRVLGFSDKHGDGPDKEIIRRIIACVNLLAPYSTEQIESGNLAVSFKAESFSQAKKFTLKQGQSILLDPFSVVVCEDETLPKFTIDFSKGKEPDFRVDMKGDRIE